MRPIPHCADHPTASDRDRPWRLRNQRRLPDGTDVMIRSGTVNGASHDLCQVGKDTIENRAFAIPLRHGPVLGREPEERFRNAYWTCSRSNRHLSLRLSRGRGTGSRGGVRDLGLACVVGLRHDQRPDAGQQRSREDQPKRHDAAMDHQPASFLQVVGTRRRPFATFARVEVPLIRNPCGRDYGGYAAEQREPAPGLCLITDDASPGSVDHPG